MKTTHLIIGLVLSGSLVPIGSRLLNTPAAPDADATTCVIARGPLTVRASYEGAIESRAATPVASRLNSSAAIMELAPEGAVVAPGDVLVRFDPSAMERDVIALERDELLARARRDEMREAEQPLELDALTMKRDEAAAQLDQSRLLLEDTRALRSEDLATDQEVAQQERDVARLERQQEAMDRQLAFTRDRLQPSALARAEAEYGAATRELARMRREIEASTVTATGAGLVVYMPLHVGGEFRTARVGDTVYRNQPFLLVADMSNLIVNCYVPEAEMARVRAGLSAEVVPAAFPDLRLPAEVESIGAMAHTLAGRPVWQKFLRVTLRLNAAPDILRSGMTVRVDLDVYSRAQATLIPRRAVLWSGEQPLCRVTRRGGTREAPLTLGPADDRHYEVLAGVEPGDRVEIP